MFKLHYPSAAVNPNLLSDDGYRQQKWQCKTQTRCLSTRTYYYTYIANIRTRMNNFGVYLRSFLIRERRMQGVYE